METHTRDVWIPMGKEDIVLLLITARELFDRGLWTEACRVKGISEYAVNEGQLDMDENIELNLAQAQELRLVL